MDNGGKESKSIPFDSKDSLSKPELETFSSSKLQPNNTKKKRKNKANNRIGRKKSVSSFSTSFNALQIALEDNFYNIDDGSFQIKEIVSKDWKTKVITDVFLASLDQRSEWVNGIGACSVLSLVTAHWLHINQDLPTRSQLNRLIIEGSKEWNNLCNNEFKLVFFPDGHFDLETILEADLRPLNVQPEESFIGFFFSEKFEMLKEAMSFDDIWDKIISDETLANKPKIYIVSWNDHFFVLKVEENACYVIDSLGGRLHTYCNEAYILKFDKSSVIYDIIKEEQDKGESDVNAKNKEKTYDHIVICAGKKCCREFIKRFWATMTLSELEEEKKKGELSNMTIFQKLQIEFHCTYLTPPSSTSSSSRSFDQSTNSSSSTQFAFSSED